MRSPDPSDILVNVAQWADELRERGHEIVRPDGHDEFGSCQGIWRLPNGYLGVSDPRRDGQVAAF